MTSSSYKKDHHAALKRAEQHHSIAVAKLRDHARRNQRLMGKAAARAIRGRRHQLVYPFRLPKEDVIEDVLCSLYTKWYKKLIADPTGPCQNTTTAW